MGQIFFLHYHQNYSTIATRKPTYLHQVKAIAGEAVLPLCSELVRILAVRKCFCLLLVLRVLMELRWSPLCDWYQLMSGAFATSIFQGLVEGDVILLIEDLQKL